MYNNNHIYVIIFFISSFIYGQEINNTAFLNNLISKDYKKAATIISGFKNDKSEDPSIIDANTLLIILMNQGQNKTGDSLLILQLKNINKSASFKKLSQAYYHLYNNTTATAGHPIIYLNEAYLDAKKQNDKRLLKLSLIAYFILYAQDNTLNENSFRQYLDEYKSVSTTLVDEAILTYYENLFYGMSINEDGQYATTSKKLVAFINANENKLSEGLRACFYEGAGVYLKNRNQIDSAQTFLKKTIALPDYNYIYKSKYNSLLDMGDISAINGEFKQGYSYFESALKYLNKSDTTASLLVYRKFKAMFFFEKMKRYDSAYYYLKKYHLTELRSDYRANNFKIADLNTRLRTSEKEKQLLLSDQEIKKQNYLLLGLGGLLFLVGIIAFLYNRNTKRKQYIAEQEKEIEIQKTEALLKNQELATIDAMIEGQEKERQRLAGDLHDNVGATLAAAKLQFEHLKNNRAKAEITDELFTKTSQLLDDAYNEIRNISHVKNSGVIAKNGLLPAVLKLAKNASANGKLHIEVSDFGLENRIENSLEITLFRVIQELVTNIIKHSKASEASISITQHEGVINVIIEDNGVGISEGKKKNISSGMGLENIEKRIEHIDGTFEIDSSPGIGTTIIIDIPAN